MAIYAIGDIQGCFDQLQRLLDKIDFNCAMDQLWFAGDLVNRGPDSLETLRFIKGLGDSAICVLGNHDLHLLAVSKKPRKTVQDDSLREILNASDCDELLHWIRHLPLIHRTKNFCLIHAGLPPQWDVEQASRAAREVEEILVSDDYEILLKEMYGDSPNQWSDTLEGWNRIRLIINCFTRLRYCDHEGKLDLSCKATPGNQPNNLLPWFNIENRRSRSTCIIFGHWSALGFYAGYNCYCIDSGCIWGGQLTALRLDGEQYRTSIPCPCYRKIENKPLVK